MLVFRKRNFQSFLFDLPSLPCLQALNINIYKYPYNFDDTNPYLPILHLPALKYAKILIRSEQSYFPLLPTVSVENFSPIEYLTVRNFTLQALIDIISLTPKLHRLTCDQLSKSYNNYVSGNFKILSNLTHMTIHRCNEVFTNVEIFLGRISSQIQVLRLTVVDIRDYLDTDRWELLIINHLPHLRVFQFHFHDFPADNFAIETHHQRLNRFLSSFWIKRQWFLQFTIDQCSSRPTVIYSIVPYDHKIAITNSEADFCTSISSSTQSFPDVQLNFRPSRNFKTDHSYIKNISTIFTIVSITTLNIEHYCSEQLILNIISLLSNLNLLSVCIFSTTKSTEKYQTFYHALGFPTTGSSEKYRIFYQSVLNSNQLTTVVLKKMNRLAQVHFFIDLCPRMKYFEVKYHQGIDLEALVQVILMKQLPQLRSLCLYNGLHDDRTVEKLEAMIEREKYTVKRVLDRIYLFWK